MTPPTQRSDRVPMRRVVPWLLLAVALVGGLVLYFRYGTQVTPLLDGTR